MRSIFTKYLPATNHRPPRVKAWASNGLREQCITQSWDYGADQDCNHMRVAMALANTLKWDGTWIEGSAGNSGNVYVNAAGDSFVIAPVTP